MKTVTVRTDIVRLITVLLSHLPMLDVDHSITGNEQRKLHHVSNCVDTVNACFHLLTTKITHHSETIYRTTQLDQCTTHKMNGNKKCVQIRVN